MHTRVFRTRDTHTVRAAQCNEALCAVFIKAPIILYIARATPTNLLYVSSDSLLLLCIRLPRARYENASVQIYALQTLCVAAVTNSSACLTLVLLMWRIG
jgi:hypothetical protein